MITQQLEVITEADTTPLLPSSLNTTNQVLTAVINALEQVGNDIVTTVTNEVNNKKANKYILAVINDVSYFYSLLWMSSVISWREITQ